MKTADTRPLFLAISIPLTGERETDTEGTFIPAYPTCLPGNIDPMLVVGLGAYSLGNGFMAGPSFECLTS